MSMKSVCFALEYEVSHGLVSSAALLADTGRAASDSVQVFIEWGVTGPELYEG